MSTLPRVLIMAGSDSGGGAGIQADIKTVSALGGFATTAVTALTVQNTLGVQNVMPVPPEFVEEQMRAVIDDIGTDCGKTGMLHSRAVIEAVARGWSSGQASAAPFVVDPVMVAQSGHQLLEDTAIDALRAELLPLATVLTPNVPEAQVLTGRTATSIDELAGLADEFAALGCAAVLLKGGHLDGDTVVDVLAQRGQPTLRLEYPRIHTRNNHGTGCTLASAVATGLASGMSLADAVSWARAYLQCALETAPDIGTGAGPVNHGHTVGRFSPFA